MIRINTVNFNENDHGFLPRILEVLPLEMTLKIKKYKNVEDRLARALGKLLLMEQLLYFGYSPDTIQKIKANTGEKPYLDNFFNFNISHAGNWAVCAGSTVGQVGIDIEKNTILDPIILLDYLSEEEQLRLEGNGDNSTFLIHLWTKKEAIIKGTGEGLSEDIRLINTLNNPETYKGRIWYLHNIPVGKGYFCSMASQNELAPQVVSFTIHTLFQGLTIKL